MPAVVLSGRRPSCFLPLLAATIVAFSLSCSQAPSPLAPERVKLTVKVAGGGEVDLGGIRCLSECFYFYSCGDRTRLTAVAGLGRRLDAWGGACSGADGGACDLSVDQDLQVNAAFADEGQPASDAGVAAVVPADGGPPGESCAGAEVISPGTLSGQTTSGFADDLRPAYACTGYLTEGRDRVYAIEVPAAARLEATVTPAPGYDAALYLVLGPARNCSPQAPRCLAGRDEGAAGVPETVLWGNACSVARTVFIVVDNYRSSDEGGQFSLTTRLLP